MKRLWICLLAFALLTGCGDSGDIAVTTVYLRPVGGDGVVHPVL